MALPVVISGISLEIATVGPYKSSDGNFYFFGRDISTETTLQCFKATDPAVSWSSVATHTGFAATIEDITAFQVGDIVHLVIVDSVYYPESMNFSYLTFNMETEVFVLDEAIASGVNVGNGARYGSLASVVVRSTGSPVVLFQGEKDDASTYGRVRYSRRTGINSWTAPVEVDDDAALTIYEKPTAILGASDSVHFLYHAGGRLFQRTLNSSNVLQASSYTSDPYCTEGISFVLDGATKCIAAGGGSSAAIVYFDSEDAPTVNDYSLGSAVDSPSVRLFSSGSTAYVLYSKSSGTAYYFRSSTDGGATWAAEQFICSVSNNGYLQNTSRFSRLYSSIDDLILPFLYADTETTELKHNHKVVASTAVNYSLSGASATSAIANISKQVGKSAETINSPAVAVGMTSSNIGHAFAGISASSQFNGLIAEGGSVTVELQSVSYVAGPGAFGLALETEGGVSRLNLTRLGPGGYPIAAVPGGPAGPVTNITLFSASAPTASNIFAGYELSAALSEAISTASAIIPAWENLHPLGSVSVAGQTATLGKGVNNSLPSITATAARNDLGIRVSYRLINISVASAVAAGDFGIEIDQSYSLNSAIATGAAGDLTAFIGTVVNLESISSGVVATLFEPRSEIVLPEATAYAVANILHMEGDEAFSLAAAAAAGTVGDLMVAIVIPAAIKWLVCASIEIMPEVAGDLAMNAELQSTVMAAAALEGSPQIAAEVDGTLEIIPIVGGTPSMKEC